MQRVGRTDSNVKLDDAAERRRRARFARSAVFEMFKYRDARCLDYGRHKDWLANERHHQWRPGP